jgi:peptide/nickel transport system permease protein
MKIKTWWLGLNTRIRVSLIMLLFLVAFSSLAPFISPYHSDQMGVGPALLHPTFAHLFGVDSFGRDQFIRVSEGLRLSCFIGFTVMSVSLLVGIPIGILSGYKGGFLDSIFSRVLDLLFAFPSLLLALVFVTILGSGFWTALLALVIIYIPISSRFVRSATLVEKDRDYISAAKVNGASTFRICSKHILPNIVPSLLVLGTNIFAFAILAEAALSYLGVGAKPPTPSLGKILTENQGFITVSSHLVIIPALTLSFLVLALNLLGDGLRDYFDPKKADGKPEKILRKLFTIRWRRTSFKTRIQADK